MKRVMLGVCLVALLAATAARLGRERRRTGVLRMREAQRRQIQRRHCKRRKRQRQSRTRRRRRAKASRSRAKAANFASTRRPSAPEGPFCTARPPSQGGWQDRRRRRSQKGVVLTFSNCEAGGKRCTTAGQKKTGTVATEALEGTLGYVNAAEHRVGLDLAGESGPVLVKWNCEGLEYEVTGSLIGEFAPVEHARQNVPGHLRAAERSVPRRIPGDQELRRRTGRRPALPRERVRTVQRRLQGCLHLQRRKARAQRLTGAARQAAGRGARRAVAVSSPDRAVMLDHTEPVGERDASGQRRPRTPRTAPDSHS